MIFLLPMPADAHGIHRPKDSCGAGRFCRVKGALDVKVKDNKNGIGALLKKLKVQ